MTTNEVCAYKRAQHVCECVVCVCTCHWSRPHALLYARVRVCAALVSLKLFSLVAIAASPSLSSSLTRFGARPLCFASTRNQYHVVSFSGNKGAADWQKQFTYTHTHIQKQAFAQSPLRRESRRTNNPSTLNYILIKTLFVVAFVE